MLLPLLQDENKRVPYQQILHDAINSKGKYTDKDVLDMFVVADLDRKGYLQKEEVAALFQNDFFEAERVLQESTTQAQH
eukprot:2519701-Amphidinium_carterae.1